MRCRFAISAPIFLGSIEGDAHSVQTMRAEFLPAVAAGSWTFAGGRTTPPASRGRLDPQAAFHSHRSQLKN